MNERPFRVAVVGSGPAGFYAADALLKADPPAEVDMIERLPTPWGLVRLGVAPDHENIKAVSRAFERIAKRPGFRFFGNVAVGEHVEHADLARIYDAIVYSVGAQTDRRLGIPGEELPGSWAATEFVAWYNGHPDFQDREFDLSCERAVIVGNGNVAIDVARMLALTAEELATTDTTDAAIEAIVSCGLREIVMLGRRGPAQAAFTPPELQELGELAGADVAVDPAELELDPASEKALEEDRERVRRNVDLLREFAARAREGKAKTLRLRFLVSPVAILGDGKVEAVEVVRNRLEVDDRGRIVAVPTEETEIIPAGVVFRSVGYRGVPLPGLPFDEGRGVIPNDRGRVEREPGVYVAGLDQARSERRHRHEQEGCLGDGRAAARGRPRGPAAPRRGQPGGPARREGRRTGRLRRLGVDRRERAGAGRTAWPAARQAGDLGRAARARPRARAP